MNDVQKKLDELVRNSDLFLASPDTVKHLQEKGLPIKSVTQTYSDYLDELFKKRRAQADDTIKNLPLIDGNIANATVQSLYEEFKEAFVMGINGAAIILAILLLDLSAKYRLYEERLKKNPKASWSPIEDMLLGDVIRKLREHETITESEEKALLVFNSKIRNNYLHYNIKKLVKDIVAEELRGVNVITGEEIIEKNVKAVDRPHLWFFAKKILDKQTIVERTTFCINWVNKLLG